MNPTHTPTPGSVSLSAYAMATRFEVVMHGGDPVRLRAAGEEALGEIERLDARLSLFHPGSELRQINARAVRGPVKVEPRLFSLLLRAGEISAATDGAFDINIAPLMRAWGFAGGQGRVPDPSDLDAARAVVGMRHVHYDEAEFTVEFDRPGIEIDLGAIGKGWAIERAAECLRESGVESAFIHGGTSTAFAIGSPPGEAAWRVGVRGSDSVVDLVDGALSVSAARGKWFAEGEVEYGHVIDPRTGTPAGNTLIAAVTGPSPTECDALSTALLVLGEPWLPTLGERFAGYRGLVVSRER